MLNHGLFYTDADRTEHHFSRCRPGESRGLVSMGDKHELRPNVPWYVMGCQFRTATKRLFSAGTRIYVHEDIYDKFLKAYTTRMSAVKVGAPFENGVHQGPQNSRMQYDKILGYIKAGIDEGATVHLGGKPVERTDGGYYIQPTIFTDVKPEMKVRRLPSSAVPCFLV